MLPIAHGDRRNAAKRLAISDGVLGRIQKLSGGGGGEIARKASGCNAPDSPGEDRFLTSAIKTTIRTAAEAACDSHRNRATITLNAI